MPDHLHCIWTLPENDANFSTRWMIIKRIANRIWQRHFWEHQIRNDLDFERHADYIHYNPVKHGYAKAAAKWPYSTFHRYVANGVYARD